MLLKQLEVSWLPKWATMLLLQPCWNWVFHGSNQTQWSLTLERTMDLLILSHVTQAQAPWPWTQVSLLPLMSPILTTSIVNTSGSAWSGILPRPATIPDPSAIPVDSPDCSATLQDQAALQVMSSVLKTNNRYKPLISILQLTKASPVGTTSLTPLDTSKRLHSQLPHICSYLRTS